MKDDNVLSGAGLLHEYKREMNAFLDKGFALIEGEQAKINRAVFAALSMEQRDVYCQHLNVEEKVKPSSISRITGKSQPTVSRHLNGKRG